MFARLCNPAASAARLFKIRQLQGEGGSKQLRQNAWNTGTEAEAGGGEGAAPPENDRGGAQQQDFSDSEDDDEWPKESRVRRATQCVDLLETCWTLERARLQDPSALSEDEEEDCPSEAESEPELSAVQREIVTPEPGMGQRSSSTSSLQQATSRRPPVSLTWALLKRQPSIKDGITCVTPLRTHRCSPCGPTNSIGGRSAARALAQTPPKPQKELESPAESSLDPPRHSRHRSNGITAQSSASCAGSMKSRFGYDISDIDEFLSKASLQSPANIPVVLASPCVLYQPGARRGRSGRGSWRQSELALPLGMVVNAVFRSHAWLYVHTPHGEAGYVRYRSCLPLGILPPSSSPAPGAWDSPTDAFPPPPPPSRPHRSRRGAASVCETRHRRSNKTDTEKLRDTVSECGARPSRHKHRHRTARPAEEAVDRLYLEASSRANSETCIRSSVAQRTCLGTLLKEADWKRPRSPDRESVAVSVKDSVSQCGVNRLHHRRTSRTKSPLSIHNTEPLKLLSDRQSSSSPVSTRTIALQTDPEETVKSKGQKKEEILKQPQRKSSSGGGRSRAETLLLITSDYNSRGRNTLSVSKGDVVVLVSGSLKDWFWVRRGDGCEGFIPAVVAGHGFL